MRPNYGNQNANLGRKRPRNQPIRTVPAGNSCLMSHKIQEIAKLILQCEHVNLIELITSHSPAYNSLLDCELNLKIPLLDCKSEN